MSNRNPSTNKKGANKKKREKVKQENPSLNKDGDDRNNTTKTDYKHDQDPPVPVNVISEVTIENHEKCLGNVSQNVVNAATSRSVEKNLNSTIDMTKQKNSGTHIKITDNENTKSDVSDNYQHSSSDDKVSKDEVDKAIQVNYEIKEDATNTYQEHLMHKTPSSSSHKHDSVQSSYKIKQELLLAALEKPSAKKVPSSAELSNNVSSEAAESNSKCQDQKVSGGTISENTAKTEKELRRLEWQKKHLEQNQKKDKEEGLSKAELKAKRREQQEAQRLAKLGSKEQDAQKCMKSTPKDSVTKEPSPIKESQNSKSTDKKSVNSKPRLKDKDVKIPPKLPIKSVVKKFALQNVTSHLFNPATNTVVNCDRIVNFNGVHPEFIRLGVKVSSNIVIGSNARCLAMLSAIKHLVFDIQSPHKQDFCRYLELVLQKSIDHLNSCRPMSVCMKNALKYFKSEVTNLSDSSASEKEKKNDLIDVIDTYIQEEIETAAKGIAMEASSKITNGDVVLTFGCSSLVEKVLLKAKEANKDFKVIVIDSCMLDGREMLRRLVVEGVQCRYVQLHALSNEMKYASLVFLGAHALLSNGYIMSRIGTAKLAMAAKTLNKPVIVCSEAYKLSDLVQSDAFVHNELGDPNELNDKDSPSASWKASNNRFALNLLYDFTPPDFVQAVITELGSFHGKSVTSFRRKKPKTLL